MANLGLLLVLVLAVAIPTSGLTSRKLDDTPALGSQNCNPCTQSPPPPPPPIPCPPPPPPPPTPCPPPPHKKPPPCSYCPLSPPPPSGYIYITGPPGSLYPIDQGFNGAGRSFAAGAPLVVVLGLLVLLALW
ncbi:hypothetical protein EUGRSUZ_B02900 [Eucalyptus grandis]|uniref:Uncharacterized protein n=2 Tax=Eucalyptus grandis TaxID=71139 RepID=A0A059D707_EUCGR|nr:hypothetical protein EUGRSUZ_B02900 [Eucalyptus grandis]